MPRYDHNTIASMCRLALRVLRKPLSDREIYRCASEISGYWEHASDLEEHIANWARNLPVPDRECKFCGNKSFYGGVCTKCQRDHVTGQWEGNAFSYG